MKVALKKQAIKLRESGKTYSEIAATIPVSKATLSVWLRDIDMPGEYKKKIIDLRKKAREKGWEARRSDRIDRIARINSTAPVEVSYLMGYPLWLIGLALYWAEGSKEKSWSKGSLVTLTNMDADAILLFRKWSIRFLSVTSDDFSYSLYVHDTHTRRSLKIRKWWASVLSVEPELIKIYFKHSKRRHIRHNDGINYMGVFRLQIKKSVDMNRRISAWTKEVITSLKSLDSVR